MIRSPLAALLCLAALPAGALPWDGTYRLSEGADCARVGEDGGALRIAEGVFQGVGASCDMTEPVDVVDMEATLYRMQCRGEGEEWTERAMVMRAAGDDAIFVIWNGYAFRYERCPEPEGAAAAVEEMASGAEPPEAGPGAAAEAPAPAADGAGDAGAGADGEAPEGGAGDGAEEGADGAAAAGDETGGGADEAGSGAGSD